MTADAPQKIVFLHIPKTAGTSLRTWLSDYVAPEKLCPERHDRLPEWDRTELNSYDLFCGHFSFDTISMIDGPVTLLTMFREPKARLLSAYYFARSHTLEYVETVAPDMLPAKTLGLVQFLSEYGREAGNEATRMIGDGDLDLAKSRLRAFSAVGIVEEMTPSLQMFALALGREVEHPMPHENVTGERCDEEPFEGAPPIREPFTPAIERLLDDCTMDDRELYLMARSFLRQRTLPRGWPSGIVSRGSRFYPPETGRY